LGGEKKRLGINRKKRKGKESTQDLTRRIKRWDAERKNRKKFD